MLHAQQSTEREKEESCVNSVVCLLVDCAKLRVRGADMLKFHCFGRLIIIYIL